MSDPTSRTLLGTTDAMVWASEFCRIFDGKEIATEEVDPNAHASYADEYIGPGTMVAWFASAMAVAEAAGKKAVCPHDDVFAIADDLSSCRKCGEVFVEPTG